MSTSELACSRDRLLESVHAGVEECTVLLGTPDKLQTPLVACARHKARSVHEELAILEENQAAVLVSLDASRTAAHTAGCDELYIAVEACIAELISTAARKRAALEGEAVVADSVLEEALDVESAIVEVGNARRYFVRNR
jgi:hypothetical protein